MSFKLLAYLFSLYNRKLKQAHQIKTVFLVGCPKCLLESMCKCYPDCGQSNSQAFGYCNSRIH